MLYSSTRNSRNTCTASQAILRGIADDGGLYVPQSLPALTAEDITALCAMDYCGRAAYILKMYLDDYTAEEIEDFVHRAYTAKSFDVPAVAPTVKAGDGTYMLELWHGPTCAFKDMALQLLPYLMTAAMKKNGEKRRVCILTATSGDTGKAALEAFADVEGTAIMVFYPENGVSDVQKLQMTTQEGANVRVCAVKGNFDDAQSGVKAIFGDRDINEALSEKGWVLSSANSINWGRLLPQIVYYVSAYCDLVNYGEIAVGDKICFTVPTGNFGDILAGWYARGMGLPVDRLVCASNANNVLTDFFETGVYDRNRQFYTTISPSMDILISSNLERLLYHLAGDEVTARCMKELSANGRYSVPAEVLSVIKEVFVPGCLSDEDTMKTIAGYFAGGMLIDTHTAVGCGVLKNVRSAGQCTGTTVVVSTANPYKFCSSVLTALGEKPAEDSVELFAELEKLTGTTAPAPLRNLAGKKVRFTGATDRQLMPEAVTTFLG